MIGRIDHAAAAVAAAGTAPGTVAIALHAPGLAAAGWRAEGTDPRRRPVRARQAPRTGGAAEPPLELMLPTGFSGRVTLQDAHGRSVGELRLQHVGLPEFQATSADLDVRPQAAGALQVDRLQQAVQCFFRVPAALAVRRAVTVDAGGAWQVHEGHGAHGVGLKLERAFRGRVLLQDATQASVLELRVQRLGQADGVQARTLPGYRAEVRSSARMLDVAVQPVAWGAVPR